MAEMDRKAGKPVIDSTTVMGNLEPTISLNEELIRYAQEIAGHRRRPTARVSAPEAVHGRPRVPGLAKWRKHPSAH